MQNNDLDDNKRLFLDMQEHPEQYSDAQLEAMMNDIDRESDMEAAWERLEKVRMPMSLREGGRTVRPRWMRVAAVFVGALVVAAMAMAAIQLIRSRNEQPETIAATLGVQHATLDEQRVEPVRFDNVTLDSILTVVSAHYHKAVNFRDEESRRMKLIMTWQPEASLTEFIERLNSFDGLSLQLQDDTIVVDVIAQSSNSL
ncbi:MAG: hypothetical protein K6D55_02380 [Prevotella sp.]|nr:hypothetical protein [Prevotella sp.]